MFSSPVVAGDGSTFGVGFGGWDGVRVPVLAHGELPVGVVDVAVAFGAEEGEVVEICCAAVVPVGDVMDLAPLGWSSAHHAAAVADDDRLA